MVHHHYRIFVAFLTVLAPAVAFGQEWKPLSDGKSLRGWEKPNFGGEGDVEVQDGQIILDYGQSMTGIRYTGKFPKQKYEIELEAKRLEGTDFFCGLTFPVGESHCSFILGGWGGSVVGLSSLDGLDASENETGQAMRLEDNRWYRVRVRVEPKRIQVWLDNQPIIDVNTANRKISTRPEVDLCKPLGISTWETRAAIRNIRYRELEPEVPDPLPPQVAPASEEPQLAMAQAKLAKGLKISLFAAEPDVANIVAINVDDQGRVWVCESFRQGRGIEDNRNHMDWLDDDLAAQRVEDRLAYLKKHLGDQLVEYTKYDDRIRLVLDEDGDGRADRATVFADHFNTPVDGTGASVLAWNGDVFYTCIPHLWKLRDQDGDGKSDQREALFSGFGVRYAFRGHDLHGLTLGPDGRLYFSIGDRGYHIEHGGRVFANPESGAIFRCELDGSRLEVVATGLRNPQELAFDDFGNLFTGDNNSDSGDRARIVYVLPGSDSGWRMAFQYLPDRGPFNREKIWHPFHEGQPAFIVPPVANFADGPSGLTYYPGTGWTDEYRGSFLLCDFRGTPSRSGIRSFRVQPKGAFFKLVDNGRPVWQVLATDAQFGPDGALYVSDWVNGWVGEGKGRIYRIDAEKADPRTREVRSLLRSGFKKMSTTQLARLLRHEDQRIRLRAQWELARRGPDEGLPVLMEAAESSDHLLARLHGIWGWEQIIRRFGDRATLGRAIHLLDATDAEVRAQAAALLGETRDGRVWQPLVKRLRDESPRVRMFAALALAHFRRDEVARPVMHMLADADNRDPALRHAGVMALVAVADAQRLVKAYEAAPEPLRDSTAVRLALVVALRRLHSSLVARFIKDNDLAVVEEAARAIHDVPILGATSALAAKLESRDSRRSDPLLRRSIAANFRLGTPQAAQRMVAVALDDDIHLSLRVAVLQLLAAWENPPPRDWVLGMWRPIPRRSAEPAKSALKHTLPRLLAAEDEVAWEATRAAAALDLTEATAPLRSTLLDRRVNGERRAEALLLLADLAPETADSLVGELLHDRAVAVRTAALKVIAKRDPKLALPEIRRRLASHNVAEQRAAYRLLASMPDPIAGPLLVTALERLMADEVPPAAQVELLEAAQQCDTPQVKTALKRYRDSLPANDPLAPYRPALAGGSVAKGEQIFKRRLDVSCRRCHSIAGDGGAVGPELTNIGAEKQPEYLLEAIVAPNQQIAKGFESAVIRDVDGKIYSGVVREETDDHVRLVTPDGVLITIPQEDIEARKAGQSAMPDDLTKFLSLHDLRDLVAFLSSLKKANTESNVHE